MAFLRSLSIRGFKTFARATELVFEPGITVLIGPNGSGKSNIADAVLWALGEQSPSTIRSRTMQDVIFSGSDGQRASAVAEVALVFDNSTGRFPVDYTEVEVRRRLLRDGTSEYRINGSLCRLLDVQELVAAVGLGREMHSVISQGRVEELVVSTPATRRALVEEAAGLGRYKKRRDRAQAKLEKVRVNLDRVSAVEREVRNALRPLKLQVTAAERYATTSEELAAVRARAVLLDLVDLRRELERRRSESGEVASRRVALEEELTRLREARGEEEARFAAALGRRERLMAQYHQARADVERLSSRAAGLRQRIARMEGDLARAERRRVAAETELSAARSRRQALGEGPGAVGARLQTVEAATATIAARLLDVRPSLEAALEDEEKWKDRVFELEAERSRAIQERDFLQRELDELSRRQESLARDEQAAASRVDELLAGTTVQQRALEEIERSTEGAVAVVSKAEAEAERTARAAREAQERLLQAEEAVAAAGARARVLEDLIGRREGVPAAARAVLAAREGSVLVSDLLRVESGYERAVAAALGPLVSAVVVPGVIEPALSGVGEGPVEIVWPEGVRSAEDFAPDESGTAWGEEDAPAGTRWLWEVVDAPPALRLLLSTLVPPTVVVDDGTDEVRSEVLDRRARSGPLGRPGGLRVVTTKGGVTHGRGHTGRRTDAAAETALAAQAEAAALERERDRLSRAVGEAAAAAAAALGARTAADDALNAALAEARALQMETTSRRDELDLAARRLDEGRMQLEEARRRREEGARLARQLRDDMAEGAARIGSTESDLEEARGSLRRARDEAERFRELGARLEGKRSQAAVLAVRLRERLRGWQEERDRVDDQLRQAEHVASAAARSGARLSAVMPVLTGLYEVTEALAAELGASVAHMEAEVARSRLEGDRFGEALRALGVREAEAQRALALEAERAVEVEVAVAHLADRVDEREHELAELRRRHLAPRTLGESDVADDSADALAAAAQRLQARLDGIGPVNPLAEQEYRETAERVEFLGDQRADLEASLQELGQIIAELDEHILTTFDEVFASISQYFTEMVEVLFPGGRGVLRLVEDEPADASEGDGEAGSRAVPGIVLEIKPPRKAPRSMGLLSGGEKALAAIAFLFALFLARPCPFYILDEVEAALDDTNLGRFLSVVRRYQDMTQFIVITHQRRTMEIADTLYGVAMDTDGTSRVLSRRLTPRSDTA